MTFVFYFLAIEEKCLLIVIHFFQNIDCYFGYDRQSVICKANKCACANGYYERYNNICRQKSMGKLILLGIDDNYSLML